MRISKYIWNIVVGMVCNFEFAKNYLVLNEISNLIVIMSYFDG